MADAADRPDRNVDGRVDRSADGAAFAFSTIAVQRGGLTRAVLRRVRLYADAGIPARLLLTDFAYREDEQAAAVRREWQLPDSVEIRYFWREAAPGGGGAPVDPVVLRRHEPGLTPFTELSGKSTVVRMYADGVLVKSKRFGPEGKLATVTHHDNVRRAVSREQFSLDGRLVYREEIIAETGVARVRRWFDGSGRCWLTCWLTTRGDPRATVRHHPTPAAYDHFGNCVARWVDDVTADWDTPVVLVDTRPLDPVLMSLEHPGARTVAIMHNCHTVAPYGPTAPAKIRWLPLLENLDSVDAVVALTGRQRDDIAGRFGAARLTVINHPTPPIRRVNVPRKAGLLVALARLDTQKQLDHAIRAFALAAPRVPGARFDIYGKGAQEQALRALVRELGLADRIRFRRFADDALRVFAGATATVLSSQFEGLPLVLAEAMVVGTPFVAYDVNYGPSEVIRHEVDGLLVPAGDIEALAGALVRVLGDPAYAATLGERAREVAERFSVDRWSAEWLGLYRRLVGSGSQGAHGVELADTVHVMESR